MKIRVKVKGSSGRPLCLDMAEDCSPSSVVARLAQELNIRPNEWCVSLNGKDPLRGGCSGRLAELGVVSGDLLWLISSGPVSNEVRDQSVAKEESCDSAPRQVNQSAANTESCDLAPGQMDQSAAKKESCDLPVGQMDQSAAKKESCDLPVGQMDQSTVKMESHDSVPTAVTSSVVPSRFSELLAALYTTAVPHTAAEVVLVVADAVLISEGITREENATVLANLGGTYRIRYTYLGKDCHVVMTTMGRVSVIQATVTKPQKAVTCQVKPSDYLNPSAALHKGPQQVLLGRTLEIMMRDRLALPVINAVRAELGLVLKGTLASLSTEIKLKVLSHLDAVSLLNVGATCSELYALTSDGYLWRDLCARDFGFAREQSMAGQAWGNDWKELYKKLYLLQKAHRVRRPGETVLDSPVSAEYWGHPQVPGVIGGDWDHLPGTRPPQLAGDYSSPLRYFFGPRRPVLPWQSLPGNRESQPTVHPTTPNVQFRKQLARGFPHIM